VLQFQKAVVGDDQTMFTVPKDDQSTLAVTAGLF
jgi:hypothetical protein